MCASGMGVAHMWWDCCKHTTAAYRPRWVAAKRTSYQVARMDTTTQVGKKGGYKHRAVRPKERKGTRLLRIACASAPSLVA